MPTTEELDDRLHRLVGDEIDVTGGLDRVLRRLRRRKARNAVASLAAVAALVVGVLVAQRPAEDEVKVVDDGADAIVDVASAPLVLASRDGVERLHGSERVRVSTEPARVAYGVGASMVVVEDMVGVGSPAHLWVWDAGEVRTIPIDPEARTAILLDARDVAGKPTAAIVERFGALSPETDFEQYVRIDLETGERTMVNRQSGWETSNIGAVLLDDGDVVALEAVAAQVIAQRLSTGDEGPVWSSEVGNADVALSTMSITTPQNGFVVLLTSTHDGSASMLTRAVIDLETGELTEPVTTLVDGAVGEFACTDYLTAQDVVCARPTAPPVLVDDVNATVDDLPGSPGAVVTVVRDAPPGNGPLGRRGHVLEENALFLYTDDAGTWAVLESGRRAPLHGVGSTPSLARDGRTIFWTRGEWPNEETVVLDARTGEQHLLEGLGLGSYRPSAQEIDVGPSFAVAPISTDGGSPPGVAVLSTSTFERERTITLGPESAGSVLSTAWDTDGEHLLAFTSDTESSWAWWWIDVVDGTASIVDVPEHLKPVLEDHEYYFLGDARAPGTFPVFLKEWGELTVNGSDAQFDATDPPGPEAQGDARINIVWPLTSIGIARTSDGTFTVRDETVGGTLVLYWAEYAERSGPLMYVAPDGTVDVLLEGLTWVDAA